MMPYTPAPWTAVKALEPRLGYVSQYGWVDGPRDLVDGVCHGSRVIDVGCDDDGDAVLNISAADAGLIVSAPEMYELLVDLEWRVMDRDRKDFSCPWCRSVPEDGHESDCRLAAVLKSIEGETDV